jgi:4-aminobutyrate aminotransferase
MVEQLGGSAMEQEMAKLSWPEAPKIVVPEIPGPKSQPIFDSELAVETPTRVSPRGLSVVWSEAFGATIKDPDGNLYIDLTAGASVMNTGHCHPKVVEVIRKECGLLTHTADTCNPNRQELGERLSKIAPGNLKENVRLAYGISGSSAVEMALKFARAATGKHLILAFQGAYHGSIGSALSLTTTRLPRQYRPLMPFVFHVGPYAYCYRCPFDLKYPDCALQCAKYVEYQISSPSSGIDIEDVAALIVEPVQADGGYVFPPPGYLEYIKKICPDMIILGKALGGALPMSAVMSRTDLVENLAPMSHVLTGAGNAVSCAVACTNIDLLQDGLMDRSVALGDYVLARFKDMAEEKDLIGDVRGKGLGIGIELVNDKVTKEPLPMSEIGRIMRTLRDRGILVIPGGRSGNVLRFIPPLVITQVHLDKTLEIIDDVLN